MKNDQRSTLQMDKLAPRSAISQQFITQVFEDSSEFAPLDVGGNWFSTESLEGFLMFGHIVQDAPPYCN